MHRKHMICIFATQITTADEYQLSLLRSAEVIPCSIRTYHMFFVISSVYTPALLWKKHIRAVKYSLVHMMMNSS